MGIFNSLFNREKLIYSGDVVYLKKREDVFINPYDTSGTIYFDIYNKNTNEKVGHCDLRTHRDKGSYYYGDVGYSIIKKHRGNRYAYYATLIIMKIAKEEYHMKEIIITCSPDNMASYKTLSSLGGEYIETVDVPEHHELYLRGEVKKCIFRYIL